MKCIRNGVPLSVWISFSPPNQNGRPPAVSHCFWRVQVAAGPLTHFLNQASGNQKQAWLLSSCFYIFFDIFLIFMRNVLNISGRIFSKNKLWNFYQISSDICVQLHLKVKKKWWQYRNLVKVEIKVQNCTKVKFDKMAALDVQLHDKNIVFICRWQEVPLCLCDITEDVVWDRALLLVSYISLKTSASNVLFFMSTENFLLVWLWGLVASCSSNLLCTARCNVLLRIFL